MLKGMPMLQDSSFIQVDEDKAEKASKLLADHNIRNRVWKDSHTLEAANVAEILFCGRLNASLTSEEYEKMQEVAIKYGSSAASRMESDEPYKAFEKVLGPCVQETIDEELNADEKACLRLKDENDKLY